MDDNKALHKLTDRNYKNLAIFSQILISLSLNYAGPIFTLFAILFEILFSYLSWQLHWITYQIVMTSIYIIMTWAYTLGSCIFYIRSTNK